MVQEVADHRLPNEIVAGEDCMKKALLGELVDAVLEAQLHKTNVHWLELEIVTAEVNR